MPKFRKRPVVIEASRWKINGDHPEDGDSTKEGKVVRYYRRPDDKGDRLCEYCTTKMDEHGWIDTLEGGHIVCPGDWVITGVAGERYPCKDSVFRATYEAVDDAASEALNK
jgi:hypothetical protein